MGLPRGGCAGGAAGGGRDMTLATPMDGAPLEVPILVFDAEARCWRLAIYQRCDPDFHLDDSLCDLESGSMSGQWVGVDGNNHRLTPLSPGDTAPIRAPAAWAMLPVAPDSVRINAISAAYMMARGQSLRSSASQYAFQTGGWACDDGYRGPNPHSDEELAADWQRGFDFTLKRKESLGRDP